MANGHSTRALSRATSLAEFTEHYVSNRDVSDAYAEQLRWMAARLQRSVGDIRACDFSLDLVNAYLRGTRAAYSPESRKSQRRMLLTLWQAAADEGLTPDPPRRKVMRIRVPDKIQTAWTQAQVERLLDAADRLTGEFSHGIACRHYWRSYILAAWDSGLRGCDLRRLTRKAIDADGHCMVVQHKTGHAIRVAFRRSTLIAIDRTFPPRRDLVWPMWGRLEAWRRAAHRLVAAAGLRGSIGMLRHSSGTAVELVHRGRGHEHLGNTRQVFERHYLDHSQLPFSRPLPPPLKTDGGAS